MKLNCKKVSGSSVSVGNKKIEFCNSKLDKVVEMSQEKCDIS